VHTIKNNLLIMHRPADWVVLQHRLIQDYGDSISISWVCRRKLGFTVRKHEAWIHVQGGAYRREPQIHLDFFDSTALSWFVLRYL
jgi:hypothetical protein